MLLPFLNTTDLLDLSQCSRGLMNYRYHLSRVTIIPHPTWVPGMEEGVSRLLSGQMSGVYVKVERRYEDVMKMVLEMVKSRSMGQHLKGLDVGVKSSDAVQLLYDAMAEGYCRGLEELDIDLYVSNVRGGDSHTMTGGDILSLLTQGACPHLRALHLTGCDDSMEAGKKLVMVMESGHLGQHLEDLELNDCRLGSGSEQP